MKNSNMYYLTAIIVFLLAMSTCVYLDASGTDIAWTCLALFVGEGLRSVAVNGGSFDVGFR